VAWLIAQKVDFINGKGTEAGGYRATRRVIHSLGSRERLLIAAANDNCARGAVAYFPEKYGARILHIILQCLNGQPVPPALYVEHKLILRDGLRFPSSA